MKEYCGFTVIPSALRDLLDGVSYGAAFVPELNCPRTWSAAKRGARSQGFGLCAAGFVCSGFLVVWLFLSSYPCTVESQITMLVLD